MGARSLIAIDRHPRLATIGSTPFLDRDMADFYEIHPDTPQPRRIDRIVEVLRDGAVMLYPTDTVYAIGCDIHVKSAVDRVRQIKRLSNNKPLTFLCSSLSDIAKYAWVSDPAYRLMKHLVPEWD